MAGIMATETNAWTKWWAYPMITVAKQTWRASLARILYGGLIDINDGKLNIFIMASLPKKSQCMASWHIF